MSKLIRWGIASAGKISEDFVIALSTLPASDHKVQAVAARSLDRAQEFATKHSIPKALGSYEELAKSGDVDVVYIGTLNPQHYEVAVLMLNNGKHVLCEKPLAMNKKQVEGILAAAKANKRFFMEAVWSRFFPSYQHVKELISSGQLGQIKDLGGGVVYDLGVYTIQASQWAFQEKPEKIESKGSLNAEGIDDDVSATLTYSGGRTARMRFSSKEKLSNTAVIKGSKGQVTLIDFWTPNKLIDIDGQEKEWLPPKGKYATNYANSEAMRYEAEAVRQSILAGDVENKNMTYADSLLFAEIEDTIRKQIGIHCSQTNLNWGIAAAGRITQDFVTALGTVEKSRHVVVAVADVDVVYVGTLNPFHYAVVHLMLARGKNVLCETPMCLGLEQAKELYALAEQRGVFLMEGMWSRFFPSYDRLRELLNSDVIGEVTQVKIQHGFRLAHMERVCNRSLGGSILMDIGIYALQLGHGTQLNKDRVDVQGEFMLDYGDGRRLVALVTGLENLENDAVITGTKGEIKLSNYWCCTLLSRSNGPPESWPLPQAKFDFHYTNTCGLRYEAEEVRRCIEKRLLESPKFTHAESLELIAITDEMRRQIGVTYEV
ncbi:hypothetical protein M5D96_005137 [Drosophila gunungcola]|uniref:Trans-1,2-dihydrobenzene-1,2-diol dehydrogenase n=1 Tax=Drosophila gunungcola TaxID=103775 RepID=A0A9P9YW70_9MUSC|nr:hypothetical protein M5D96_005137 [Drosophila gunungcola]